MALSSKVTVISRTTSSSADRRWGGWRSDFPTWLGLIRSRIQICKIRTTRRITVFALHALQWRAASIESMEYGQAEANSVANAMYWQVTADGIPAVISVAEALRCGGLLAGRGTGCTEINGRCEITVIN